MFVENYIKTHNILYTQPTQHLKLFRSHAERISSRDRKSIRDFE